MRKNLEVKGKEIYLNGEKSTDFIGCDSLFQGRSRVLGG